MDYFWTAASYAARAAIADIHPDHAMISYAAEIDPPQNFTGTLFVDSGGFSTVKRNAGYPRDDEQYLSHVNDVDADYFSLRDYPTALAETYRGSTDAMIDYTVEHHIQLFRKYQRLGPNSAQPVAVLQGTYPEEFVDMAERLERHRCLPSYLGIGGMAYAAPAEKVAVARKVSEAFPRRDIHGFGFQVADFEAFPELVELVDSADTNRWDWHRDHSTWREMAEALRERQTRLRDINGRAKQTTLGIYE